MKDEAVSPVVAFMLLLMIVVSFIAVLNAYYIPSLKQQAEIEHLKNVEDAFCRIETDINHLISFKENAILKEHVPLGGGDVIFSPIRSSGRLQIQNDREIGIFGVQNTTGFTFNFPITTVNITYRPIDNFWMNQGYEWGNGTVNVTKGKKSTSLAFLDSNDARNSKHTFLTLLSNPSCKEMKGTSPIYPDDLGNATIITSTMISTPGKTYMSSNGVGGVILTMDEHIEDITNVSKIFFSINSTLPHDETDCIRLVFEKFFSSNFNYPNVNARTISEVNFISDREITVKMIIKNLNVEIT